MVKCKYEQMNDRELAYGALRRAVVAPPTVFGARTTQLVGWRVFLHGSVMDDYRSPLQTATAWEGYAPKFEAVRFELDRNVGDTEYITATIRLIWYADDGSKEKVVDHAIGSEYYYINGRLRWHLWGGGCESERQVEFRD